MASALPDSSDGRGIPEAAQMFGPVRIAELYSSGLGCPSCSTAVFNLGERHIMSSDTMVATFVLPSKEREFRIDVSPQSGDDSSG